MLNKFLVNFEKTDPYDWEGDSAVKQVLVFACYEDKKMADEFLEKHGYFDYSEICDSSFEYSLGAILKLRAVKKSDGYWIAKIRSPISGITLAESGEVYFDYVTALKKCEYMILNID